MVQYMALFVLKLESDKQKLKRSMQATITLHKVILSREIYTLDFLNVECHFGMDKGVFLKVVLVPRVPKLPIFEQENGCI